MPIKSNFVELDRWENLYSTDSCHSPGAFKPKALRNCGKISFLPEKPTWRRRHFVLLTELRKLATHWNFGGNLYEGLRERLACGLQNMQIQKQFLSEAKLKYSKAVEIAVAMETAMRDTSEYSELNSNQVPRVDMLTEHNKPTQTKMATTPHCTVVVETHIWQMHSCFYKDWICHHCEKQGHIQRVCCSKQQGKPKQVTKTPHGTCFWGWCWCWCL